MDISVGKAIREIKKGGLKPAYFLKGDDSYLQKFFINYINNKFDKTTKVKYIDLNDISDQDLFFNDLNSMSLFSSKNIFSIRNFSKLSKNNKEYLIEYFSNPNSDVILLFILDDYMLKNKFSKDIHKKCIQVDTNTPYFNSKIKAWTKYYMQINKIELDNYIIDDLINSYGDNISNVISEVEKLFLITNKRNIKFDDYVSSYKNRNLKNWHLMDAIASKNIKKSIHVFDSLIINGTPMVSIISNHYSLFFIMLNSLYGNNINDYRINKTLQSRIPTFNKKYHEEEILNIIIELRNIDILSKTTSLDSNLLFHPFIIKVCKGYYAK